MTFNECQKKTQINATVLYVLVAHGGRYVHLQLDLWQGYMRRYADSASPRIRDMGGLVGMEMG